MSATGFPVRHLRNADIVLAVYVCLSTQKSQKYCEPESDVTIVMYSTLASCILQMY